MHSDNTTHQHIEVRRQDRLLDDAGQETLLNEGEFGVLSMNTDSGGYGIPFSFAYERTATEKCIYFHCAPKGRKLAELEKDNRVSFCIVGRTKILPDKFMTAYESVIAFGNIAMHLPDEERRKALRLLVKKYCPEYIEKGEKYMEASFHCTNILRLDIEHLTGKTKLAPPVS